MQRALVKTAIVSYGLFLTYVTFDHAIEQQHKTLRIEPLGKFMWFNRTSTPIPTSEKKYDDSWPKY